VTSDPFYVLTFVSALGCGLAAGAFFAFSTFIMKALGRLPAAQGIAAMQSINVAVITPLFMLALFGTGAACLVLAIAAPFVWQTPGAAYVRAGGFLYVLGTVVVTMVFNVPRNNALARVDPASAEGSRLWAGYLSNWTAWNHMRTIAALAATALLTIGLCASRFD
jgi:uncharacterized membrane protein